MARRVRERKESERRGSILRADEVVAVGPNTAVVGAYRIDEHGRRGEPLFFQVATIRDGKLAGIRDYRRREQALKAAKKAAASSG